MKVTFRWNDETGEGNISKVDADRLLEAAKPVGEWVTVADFLQDAIWDVTKLYNRVLREARDRQGRK